MNRLYYKLLFIAVLFSGIAACSKDGEQIIIHTSGSPELTASATEIALDAERADATALQLNWTMLDAQWSDTSVAHGSIAYALQIAKATYGFRDSVTTVDLQAEQSSYTFTVSSLNALLVSAGCEPGIETQVDMRLVTSLAPNAPVYSNVITLTATPYVPISYLYVPGAYQNWAVETAEVLVSPTSNNIYQGIIYFPTVGSEFKITTARSWDAAYGDAGDGKISLSAGDNIKSPGSGNYQLIVNTQEHTIAFTPYSWGIVGDATPGGWDTDTDMIYSNIDGVWRATVEMTAGEYKFRKDKAWDLSLGGSEGTLTDNGDNIAVTEAGTYDIVLNVDTKTYTITKK